MSGRRVVVTMPRPNREAAVALLCIVGVPLVFVSVGGLIEEGFSVLVLALGIPGLLLLIATVPIYRKMKPRRDQLIFDADGFGFRGRKGEWSVPWTDITAITLSRVLRRDDRRDVCYLYLDFWPANRAVTQRPDLARLWQARRATRHFRMPIGKSEWLPQIRQGIVTFRRDLWRPTVTHDYRKEWWR